MWLLLAGVVEQLLDANGLFFIVTITAVDEENIKRFDCLSCVQTTKSQVLILINLSFDISVATVLLRDVRKSNVK